MAGGAYAVKVVYSASEAGSLEGWRLSAAAFELNGKPLAERPSGASVPFSAGAKITVELDLAAYLPSDSNFTLAFAGKEPTQVTVLKAAPAGVKYLDLAPADLAKYQVVLQTDLGDMTVQFYPNEAPNHVRNFLDLAATGFYDGIGFHRVSPTFMIQGGCPNTKGTNAGSWGTGSGPRQLNAEFNKIHHERGILSMARSQSPNSASSQFFIMTKESGFLDNQYSVFGKLVSGFETLDKIANSKGKAGADGTVKPDVLPRIKKAVVITAG
jgi:cyclophilin family peptidyl-prolyl cis-trans isomerase